MNFDIPQDVHDIVVKAVEAVRANPAPDASGEAAEESARMLFAALARAGVFDSWTRPPGGHYLLGAVELARALAYENATATTLYFVNGVCGAMIAGAGGEAQEDLLAGLRSGAMSYAFALTEPEAGSDAAAVQTTARRDGDAYVINGRKRYTTGAAAAHRILAVARTEPEGKARNATSLLLVPGAAEGLTVTPMNKVASNGFATCELTFENVRVGINDRLGEENGAWPFLQIGGLIERLIVAAGAVGLARRAYDNLRAWLGEREQFGQPVLQFQAVRHQLADMAAMLEAIRWLPVRAAWLADKGENPVAEINMAKLVCVEQSNRIIADAMRLAGGRGYLQDDVFNRTWREGALGLFAGGTLEIQRETIARALKF